MHALLFTDLVDSTQLLERMGDAAAATISAEHDRRARGLLAGHGGREIDRSDGFFLLFDEVARAAQYALAYHHAIAELGLGARVGLHVGAVTLRPNAAEDVARGAKPLEVEGLAKPLAARIMGLARGGQTLLSAEASGALRPALSGPALLECHGHYRLKGIAEPVEIFELGDPGCSFTPPADTDKAYRVVRAEEWWQPLREIRHNLAPERDTFIGRTVELRGLAQRLDAGVHLLTLLGPGGTGKTRLARRYARSWLGDWPGGVYFCDLSEARSLDGIHFAVALALGVPLGKDDPGVQLGHAIAGRGRCLVMLDNFEQVLQHAPATVGRWLDRSAQAAFIVTSRERLQLPGEEIFPIEPLPLGSEAIELFEARARAQRPEFALGPSNRDAVAEVVRLLDGLPLAIELAAARIRIFSPGQLVQRMKDRFSLLAGAKGAAARQATLKAAIDWSWDLLTPWEQGALAQCSVFEGGFTMEAAEAVLDLAPWPDAPPAMDAVQALVDKSLLRAWVPIEQDRFDIDEPYFGMYLSIHEYAADKLENDGHAARRRAHARHGQYFATFGTDEAIDALSGHGGLRLRRALALELDNVVAACRRSLDRGDALLAVPTFRATSAVLERQGPFGLGVELGSQVLAFDDIDPAMRAAASVALALCLRRIGCTAQAMPWLEGALVLAQQAGNRRCEGLVRGQLSQWHSSVGEMDLALQQAESALAIGRELGERALEATCLGILGNLHTYLGDVGQARIHIEAALAIHRAIGNRMSEGAALSNLGVVCQDQGLMEQSRVHQEAAIAIHRETGNRVAEGIMLGNLGTLHNDQGRLSEAQVLYERALAIHREVGDRVGEAVTTGNLVKVELDQGRIREALAHAETGLGIAREVGARREEGIVLGHIGTAHMALGHVAEAVPYYRQALAIAREIGNRRFEGETLGNLGDALSDQGRFSEAHEAVEAGVAVLREIGDLLDLGKILCIRGQLEVATGNADAARATLAEALALAQATGAGPDSESGRQLALLQEALA